MSGGIGNDTFTVDDPNDRAIEATGEGSDRVYMQRVACRDLSSPPGMACGDRRVCQILS